MKSSPFKSRGNVEMKASPIDHGGRVLESRRLVTSRDLASGQVRIRLRPEADDGDEDPPYVGNPCLREIKDLAERLKCCTNLAEGKRLHRQVEAGPHRRNRFLANMLVEMYGKLGQMQQARALFDGILDPNLFSWNILVAAYARNGDLAASLAVFQAMPMRDVVTWTAVVTAFIQNGSVDQARAVFESMPERNSVSWNVIIEAYAQAGLLEDAMALYSEMPEPNVVTRTSLMAALAQDGRLQHVLAIFSQMPERDVVAWTVVLQASAHIGDLRSARKIFDTMPQRNLVSWNSMLQAYSRNVAGLELYHLLNLEGLSPDDSTFICVLNCCGHLGLVQESMQLLAGISVDHGQVPSVEHECCLVDLLGRAGRLEEAASVVATVNRVHADTVPWSTIVSAARMHGDLQRGSWAAKKMLDLEPGKYALAYFVNT